MQVMVRPATQADLELFSALNVDVQAVHATALPERFKQVTKTCFRQRKPLSFWRNRTILYF